MELILLYFYLLIAFVIAPVMTNSFFLNGSKAYSAAHIFSLTFLIAGTSLGFGYTALVWPLFCAYGFTLYLKREYKLTACISFVFSLISAIWLVAAVNDLHLLGYGKEFSFYAAIHGSFIGWILVGCFASLPQKIYQRSCYLAFVFFLLVAFGINGIPYIKPIGAIGFSLMLPLLIGKFRLQTKNQPRLLATMSLCAIVLSMGLALLNEFWSDFPRIILDLPVMVLIHGFLNAVIAIPCLFIAVSRYMRVPSQVN